MLELDWMLGMLGVVDIELLLLPPSLLLWALAPAPGMCRMVASEPELSSEFSSILVSFEAVFKKLFTASLLFMGGILAKSLS